MNVSQEKLADDLEITFQQIQKYEAAANRIPSARLYRIASILEVPIEYFFRGYKLKNDERPLPTQLTRHQFEWQKLGDALHPEQRDDLIPLIEALIRAHSRDVDGSLAICDRICLAAEEAWDEDS